MIWQAVGALAAVLVPLMLLFFGWLRSDIQQVKSDLGVRLDKLEERLNKLDGRLDRALEPKRWRERARP